jgi:CTP:molybdopterin cytidylyltransferase MocA
MKVLILAAGYATRLYPLTLTQPKPLLPVAGKPMIDYVMDNLAPIGGIDDCGGGDGSAPSPRRERRGGEVRGGV